MSKLARVIVGVWMVVVAAAFVLGPPKAGLTALVAPFVLFGASVCALLALAGALGVLAYAVGSVVWVVTGVMPNETLDRTIRRLRSWSRAVAA